MLGTVASSEIETVNSDGDDDDGALDPCINNIVKWLTLTNKPHILTTDHKRNEYFAVGFVRYYQPPEKHCIHFNLLHCNFYLILIRPPRALIR